MKFMMIGKGLGMMTAICFVSGSVVSAQQDPLEQITAMEQRITHLEARLARYESRDNATQNQLSRVQRQVDSVRQKIDDVQAPSNGSLIAGIDMSVGATMVYQFTDKANGASLSKNSEDVGDASYSVDLEFTKEFEDYGAALVLFEAGEGAGVEDELQVFSNVNFDATGGDSNPGIVEAWYEQYMGSATLRFGKLDPTYLIDNNDYANDEAGQFLGRIFRNNPAVAFADNGVGVRLALAPHDRIEIESIAMDGDGDWDDVLEDLFYAGQVNVKANFWDRPGNYRFYAWASEADHIKWDDGSQVKEDNYGFGISFDQELTDDLGVFARYGWQNPDVYAVGASESLEQSCSIGAQLAGRTWDRENDVLGLALGMVIPSDEYKNSNSALKADTERHLELYYSYMVNDHVTVSPDLQVIWDPYGGDAVNGDKTIIVGGIRSQIDF